MVDAAQRDTLWGFQVVRTLTTLALALFTLQNPIRVLAKIGASIYGSRFHPFILKISKTADRASTPGQRRSIDADGTTAPVGECFIKCR
jgi:hypothetical protein